MWESTLTYLTCRSTTYMYCTILWRSCVCQRESESETSGRWRISKGSVKPRVTLAVYTHRKRTLWQNKAVFWWVAMNAVPHTSNPKLAEPTSRPSNQVPPLPVVTVLLKLSTDFILFFPAQETVVWSCSQKIAKTYSQCDFPSLNRSNQIQEHSGSLSLFLLCLNDLAFVNHVPVQESIIL